MANTKYLFNRDWTVEIQRDDQDQAVRYKKLRVVFDIEKNNYSSSNKAKIDVYNFDLTSRQRFVKGSLLTLDAGYVGQIETIFRGNVVRVTTERNGSETITSFECGDGERAMAYGIFSKSYPPGATYKQILQDICTELKNNGVGIGLVLSFPPNSFNSGVTFNGTIKDALDYLTNNIGYSWSIQNGQVQIIPNVGFDGEQAIFISEETGMIGVPSQGADFVQFSSLLNPKIAPDCRIALSSQAILGDFKVNKAKYEGDSHSMNKWTVSCECVRINPTQSYIPNRGLNFATGLA